MKMLVFAKRTAKEILRDPLTLLFGVGFPVILLLLLTMINKNVPSDLNLFDLNYLTPGIAVFGLSFLSLFSAQLIAKDRASSLLLRLFTTPMNAADYILGYTLPLIPMALAQGAVCYLTAFALGLPFSPRLLYAYLLLLPSSLVFIGIGLLCGSVLNEKAVGGICGALLTNLAAWLSGTWFSLELVGGAFKTAAYSLPFVHAVDMGKDAANGVSGGIGSDLVWVLGYSAALLIIACVLFRRKMKV